MTVGSGISPDLLTPRVNPARALAGSWSGREASPHTAGGELHPALKTYSMPASRKARELF
jgi:hypothetical protein